MDHIPAPANDESPPHVRNSGTERQPDRWQPISEPMWRVLKGSIVAAGMRGAISPERAQGLIERFHLKEL